MGSCFQSCLVFGHEHGYALFNQDCMRVPHRYHSHYRYYRCDPYDENPYYYHPCHCYPSSYHIYNYYY